MKRATLACCASVAVAVAAAGCGSSATNTATKTTSSATPASASGPYGAAASSSTGAYGAASAASSSSTAASATAPAPKAVITTKSAKLGTILAYGPKQLTVYLFEADKGGASNCSGACAKVWPPVTGSPQAAGQAQASNLGTIKRPDGTTQVTYKGHPLYLFVKDGDKGDAYGQGINGFGASWYVLAPSGNKVDKS